MEKSPIRVAFIDSGVDLSHPALMGLNISGATILDNGEVKNNVFDDQIGHGTGVVYNFFHNYDSAECFMLKIFDEEEQVDEHKIINALKYIYINYPCQIINISCGISFCANILELNDICEALLNRGTIIVAGYDNNGALSYPACFKSVIGVDVSTSCFRKTDIQYVESNLVNIRGFGYQQSLPSLNKSYQSQMGSSFVAPYISALIAKFMDRGIVTFDDIKIELKKLSKTQYSSIDVVKNTLDFSIQKAVAFPFNKEMHALIAFASDLNFELVDIYDHKYGGKIGHTASDEVKVYHTNKNYIIKNIDSIDWNSFDTFIMGHMSKIELATGKDLKRQIIKLCVEHGKNIYFYDMDGIDQDLLDIMDSRIFFYSPEITEKHIRTDQFGKLYEIGKPVVGFFGTSPKQGKMTTLLLTKQYMSDKTYHVGVLGTEPNSLLLGLDEEYNMGFNSTVRVSGDDAIEYVNGLMHDIELKQPDIIMVGSQSQTVCLNTGNLGFYPHTQYELLLATQPDAFVVNINVFDSDEYILRTINFLESTCSGAVLCLVLFPIRYDNYQGHLIGHGVSYNVSVLNEEISRISSLTGKEVFLLDEHIGKKVGDLCIKYFSESEICNE